MTKLSDTQRILLSNATQRDNGSLLPLPTTLKSSGGTSKAIAALVNNGYAEERETDDASATSRTDGDLRYGVFVTAAGAAAIGVETQPNNEGVAPATTATPRKRGAKTANVLALLERQEGATLAELIAATGWLPHSTRAALTGLRKKGHDVIRGKRDGATCYRIVGQA